MCMKIEPAYIAIAIILFILAAITTAAVVNPPPIEPIGVIYGF